LETLTVLFTYAIIVAIFLPSCSSPLPPSVGFCRNISSGALAIPVSICVINVLFGFFGERMNRLWLLYWIATWLPFALVLKNIFARIDAMWYALGVFVFFPILLILTALISSGLKSSK